MKHNNNKADRKNHGKDPKKIKIETAKHAEDFNTGSHSPSSLLNVDADYDDTGKGNDSQTSSGENKKTRDQQSKRKENSKSTKG